MSTKANSTDRTVISLSRGSCKGRCPVYSIIITENKEVVYQGVKNTTVTGNKSIQLTKSQYKELIQSFKDSGFEKLKENYLSGTRDLPKMEISYMNKTVIYHKKNAPEILIELAKKVDALCIKLIK